MPRCLLRREVPHPQVGKCAEAHLALRPAVRPQPGQDDISPEAPSTHLSGEELSTGTERRFAEGTPESHSCQTHRAAPGKFLSAVLLQSPAPQTPTLAHGTRFVKEERRRGRACEEGCQDSQVSPLSPALPTSGLHTRQVSIKYRLGFLLTTVPISEMRSLRPREAKGLAPRG